LRLRLANHLGSLIASVYTMGPDTGSRERNYEYTCKTGIVGSVLNTSTAATAPNHRAASIVIPGKLVKCIEELSSDTDMKLDLRFGGDSMFSATALISDPSKDKSLLIGATSCKRELDGSWNPYATAIWVDGDTTARDAWVDNPASGNVDPSERAHIDKISGFLDLLDLASYSLLMDTVAEVRR
jgi:hypothetical protein